MITWIIMLVVVGLILLAVEMFIPGWIVGIIGGFCILAAIILIFIAPALAPIGMAGRGLLALGVAGLSVAVVIIWARTFHLTPVGRALIVSDESGDGGINPTRIDMAGETGRTLTDLRPVGKIRIDGEIFEARVRAGSIAKDVEIVVVSAAPGELIVRPRPEEAEAPDSSDDSLIGT